VLAVGLLDLVPEDLDPPAREVVLEAAEVERLVNEREEARRNRDFATADEIRDMLERLGIEVRDTPEETVWKVRPATASGRTSRAPRHL
jgi:cysteinyl-tRNA synthetase